MFSQEDLARLRQIKRLVEDHGVNLAGVDLALALTDRITHIRHALGADAKASGLDLGQPMDEILLTLLAAADGRCHLDNSLEDPSD